MKEENKSEAKEQIKYQTVEQQIDYFCQEEPEHTQYVFDKYNRRPPTPIKLSQRKQIA